MTQCCMIYIYGNHMTLNGWENYGHLTFYFAKHFAMIVVMSISVGIESYSYVAMLYVLLLPYRLGMNVGFLCCLTRSP